MSPVTEPLVPEEVWRSPERAVSSKMAPLTGSSQAQQHSHPEDPEGNKDGKCPQWLEEQERAAADGFVCHLEKLDCRFHSPSECEDQDEENRLLRERPEQTAAEQRGLRGAGNASV